MILRDERMHAVDSFDDATYIEYWGTKNNSLARILTNIKQSSKERVDELRKEYEEEQEKLEQIRGAG